MNGIEKRKEGMGKRNDEKLEETRKKRRNILRKKQGNETADKHQEQMERRTRLRHMRLNMKTKRNEERTGGEKEGVAEEEEGPVGGRRSGRGWEWITGQLLQVKDCLTV